MAQLWPILLAQAPQADGLQGIPWYMWLGGVVVAVFVFMFVMAVLVYGRLWFQAYMSNARVSFMSLIGMSLRQVNANVILKAKIMARDTLVTRPPARK